jgi:hypothetical protein
MKRHYSTTSNCNLELPDVGATMKFKNYKDLLTRPFIVYADFEASLIKTHRTDRKTHRHIPNSAAFHLVCTFDNTRNEYHKFNGEDCAVQMIKNNNGTRRDMYSRNENEPCDDTVKRR